MWLFFTTGHAKLHAISSPSRRVGPVVCMANYQHSELNNLLTGGGGSIGRLPAPGAGTPIMISKLQRPDYNSFRRLKRVRGIGGVSGVSSSACRAEEVNAASGTLPRIWYQRSQVPSDTKVTFEQELGYTIDRNYWGQGYASEAAARVFEYASSTMPFRRDRKSTRLNSSHQCLSRMPSSA